MIHLQDDNPNRGRVKRTVLFHALEEGVVTAATLHKLTGLGEFSTSSSLKRLRECGLMPELMGQIALDMNLTT